MAGKRPINGDLVEHGEVVGGDDGVTYNRPYRIFYNPYGVAARLPADAAQMSLWMEAGWALHKPANPLELPESMKQLIASTSQDVTEAERLRMNSSPAEREKAVQPTATYYTREGSALHNLPADPQSMADYLAAGLSLDPPKETAGESKRLRAV